MTRSTPTRSRKRSANRRREQVRIAQRKKQRRRIWITIAALAVTAGVLWMMVARGSRPDVGEPVDAFMHVHGLAIPAWAPDTLYLSTHQGLIALDPDDGWVGASGEAHDFMGYAAHPTDRDVFYSSGHPAPLSRLRNPIGFMVSTDGGVTWGTRSLEGEADFHAMALKPTDGDVIYGWNVSQGSLHRSLDAGHTWERIPPGLLEQAGGAFSLAVHPVDADRVFAGTGASLLMSDDGGATWEVLLEERIMAIATDGRNPDRLVAYASQGLLVSRDGGASWDPLGLDLGDDAVSHIALHPTDEAILYVGTIGQALYRSTDGGTSWDQLADGGRLG